MEDELSRYLDDLGPDDSYRVEAVLKEGALETTEMVWMRGHGGTETGPFIRKTIKGRPNAGQAYERLLDAQQRGRRFLYLPRVIDCRESDGSLAVVMEYVNGVTLAQLVESGEPSLGLARGVFPFACDGATELHERFSPPLIHRDLKPGNVMVSEGGITLIDLGIARNYVEGAQTDTCCFGTRAYAPPEQFGFGQTDVRSDVYALGLLLFFCLTGRDPSPADRERGFADPTVPEPLRRVIAKAAAFDPSQRYQSAAELKGSFFEGLRLLESEAGIPAGARSAEMPPPQGRPWPSASGAPAAPTGAASSEPRSDGDRVPYPAPAAWEGAGGPRASAPGAVDGRKAPAGFWEGKPEAVGVLVDVLLMLLSVFVLYVVVDMSFDPSPDSRGFSDPLPIRFAEDAAIGLFVMIPPLYLLADKRPLRRLSSAFKPLTKRESGFVIAAGWIIVLLVFMVTSMIRRSLS